MTDTPTPAAPPTNDPFGQMIFGVARSLLLYEGGQLVASHTLTAGQESQAVGQILALGALAWSIAAKWAADRKFRAALAAPPPAAPPAK